MRKIDDLQKITLGQTFVEGKETRHFFFGVFNDGRELNLQQKGFQMLSIHIVAEVEQSVHGDGRKTSMKAVIS